MQRRYQTWIVSITALLMAGEYYLKAPLVADIAKEVRIWGIIIGIFALSLGTVNLAVLHGQKIRNQKSGWLNSAVMLCAIVVFALTGITQGTGSRVYTDLYDAFLAPMATALFGTLIFFIVSAGYRSFVIRKLESGVILVSALIVMLAAVPLGRMISPLIPDAATWMQDIPNNAGQRGLVIGAAIGAVANGLRVMLGLERNFGN